MNNTNEAKFYEFKNLSELLESANFGDLLTEKGFVKLKNDYTKWHKVENGFLYTVIIKKFANVAVYYKVQPLCDYLWLPYTEESMFREVWCNHFGTVPNEGLLFYKKLPEQEYLRIPKVLERMVANYALPYFDSITDIDSLSKDRVVRRDDRHEMLILAYLNEDYDEFEWLLKEHVRKNLSCVTEYPAKWKHKCDEWNMMFNYCCYKTFDEGDYQIFGDYLEMCRKFNEAHLKKYGIIK